MSHGQGHEGCGCGCGGGPVISPAQAERWQKLPDNHLVCPCAGVDKGAVKAAIAAGAHTAPLVKAMTGAGREPGCKQRRECAADLEALVALYAGSSC